MGLTCIRTSLQYWTCNIQRLWSAGDNDCNLRSGISFMLLLHSIVFRKFHVTDNENMHDHITSDRRSRNMHDQIVFCAFHLFFSGSPNECWLHTYDECVIFNNLGRVVRSWVKLTQG